MPIAINGSGTLTGISVGGLPDGIVDADMLASNAVTAGKLASGVGGKILQVKSAQKTDRQTSTSASYIDITGLSVDMTISNSGNQILMSYNVTTGGNWWDLGPVYIRLVQDSTAIGQLSGQSHSFANMYADNQGNSSYNLCTQSGTFLFTPSDTNSHTYKVQSQGNNANGYAINGWWANSSVTCVSNITLMEVAV